MLWIRRAARCAVVIVIALAALSILPASRAQESTETPTPAPYTYIVMGGDSLLQIAQRFGVTWQEMAAINQLADINTIRVGQRLIIPITATPGAGTATEVQPIVSITDTPPPSLTPSPTLTTTPTPTLSPTLPPPTSAASATPIMASGALETVPTSTPTQAVLVQPVSTIVLISPVPPTDTPTITPTATIAPPSTVNGVPIDQIIVINDSVRENIRAIFATGETLGRNPNAFSKVGDSTIENPFFLARFDDPAPNAYNLGDYAYLQRVIDTYRGSFGRDSIAVRVGLHTWSLLDPMWADPYNCNSGETLLACEIRHHNPSVMIIRLGSNDVGVPNLVDRDLRQIVDFCVLNGIVPILGTKADRFDGPNNTNNNLIRQIAQDYALPLWDFDLIAGTIPGRGLLPDAVHMTSFYPHDWTQPAAFQTGHGIHNLTALIALDAVRNVLGVEPAAS
ncbi:MAG: LysM peptidoglycan-binding domain-containing protein [Anaerolineae bacterium]